MSFDLPELIVSIVVGAIGFVLFSYGRSMKRPPHTLVGVALMAYPYFVSGPYLIAGVALVLCVGLFFAVRWGW